MAELPSAPDVDLTPAERVNRRAQIAAYAASALAGDQGEQINVDAMTRHYFASGVYAREMRIPKGATVVGKLHKTEHLSILLSGVVRITTETGTVDLAAPQVMVSPPGTQRIAHALTPCRWLAFHAVGDERDLEKIEERFIAKDFDDPALAHLSAAKLIEDTQ